MSMETTSLKRLMKEGGKYLFWGIFLGVVIQTILYSTAPHIAPKVTHAGFTLVGKKVSLLEALGLRKVFSIFFGNLISIAIIVGFPELGLRYDNYPKMYIDVFPKVAIFFIGLVSLGLIFPPLMDLNLFIFFLFYLIPHGITELTAMLLAYTIPREYSFDLKRPFPKRRTYLIVLLLAFSAIMEIHVSIPFA
ncbi:MAG: hypothetical protein ACE5PM_04885, partial [Candidatus Hydrothermarchaeales archaeon]